MAKEEVYDGLRVLDMSQGVAGPYCAAMLALQGADVVKVEPPSGDWIRLMGGGAAGMTPLAVVSNLGKRSLCIDARTQRGRAALERLAERADVLVENFRPGVMARLGLDAGTLRARHPALIYLSVSGFGASGPWADKGGSDSVLQAFSGLAMLNRGADGLPRRVGLLVPDTVSALYAAQALSAALYARSRSGLGRHVQLSLAECCAAFQAAPIYESELFAGGQAPPTAVPSGLFRTADGFVTLLVLRQEMWERLCDALGRDDWRTNADYCDTTSRAHNAAGLNAAIAQQLAQQPSAYWIATLEAADVLCAEVHDYAQFRGHEQMQHLGVFGELSQPPYGPLPMPYLPGVPRDRPIPPAPIAGQHTRVVLAEIGYTSEDIAALERGGIAVQA